MTGLDGVVVADTALSEIDGARGRLRIRGVPLEELAGRLSFEQMLAFLWGDLHPSESLGEARERVYVPLEGLPRARDMDGLRRVLAALPGDCTPLELVAAIPLALVPGRPDPGLGQAQDFLRLRGSDSPPLVRALNAYLVTVAEHGMNASTFTARVVASTRAGAKASVIAALCALQGPLHGGAPGPVLDMLDALEAAPDRKAWLRQRMASGERLMGFGHRVYQVRDPRAEVLRQAVQELRSPRLELAQRVEQEATQVLAELKPGRRLETNVEFYTAVLLEALGIPRELFTCIFAMGRVVGWLAHVFEQEASGRLIRPEARYVGPSE